VRDLSMDGEGCGMVAALRDRLERQRNRFRVEITKRDATIRDLRALVDLLASENRRLNEAAVAADWIAALESARDQLQNHLARMDERLREATDRSRALEEENRALLAQARSAGGGLRPPFGGVVPRVSSTRRVRRYPGGRTRVARAPHVS